MIEISALNVKRAFHFFLSDIFEVDIRKLCLSFIDGEMAIEFVSTFHSVTLTRGTQQHVFRGPIVESQAFFHSRINLSTVLRHSQHKDE